MPTIKSLPPAEDFVIGDITVPPEIVVNDAAEIRLQECVDFLNSVPDLDTRLRLHRTLIKSLDHIGNIARNYSKNPARLSYDHAPLSLGWCAGTLVGGLIFHGYGVGGGGYPTLAVTLDNTTGWQLHT